MIKKVTINITTLRNYSNDAKTILVVCNFFEIELITKVNYKTGKLTETWPNGVCKHGYGYPRYVSTSKLH